MDQPVETLPKMLESTGIVCCRLSRFDDASQAAENAELTDEVRVRKQMLIDEAINTLRMAIDNGWDDFDQLRTDSDLAPLREFESFQKLLP